MYEEFTRARITQLRMQKNISARELSLSLGQNEGYITQIENGRKMPSWQGLFYICEYFGISPKEFFDDANPYPDRMGAVVSDLERLSPDTFAHIAIIIKELAKQK